MKSIGLDVSTKTGFAVIQDGILLSKGLIKLEKKHNNKSPEDLNLLANAEEISDRIWHLIDIERPDKVMIEQTNAGRFRQSQKQLEFLHCLILQKYQKRVDSDTKVPSIFYVDTSKWRSSLSIRLTKEQRKHNKSVKDGKSRGKITSKHLAVAWANSKFDLKLKLKDNDIADAICLAFFGDSHFETKQYSFDTEIDRILK